MVEPEQTPARAQTPARDRAEIDLAELEIDNDAAGGQLVVRWVDELRARAREHGRVRVYRCPQMLAHTLYKAGLLRDQSIELIDVRQDEPYG